ncbi:MAG: insulinase family protein [Firmicutes bacterium]|nr:insulinase family protein [Alicyclobacillaceae bacterium]MCL6497172.1 insulinase family protein [Bacillota bacterium]
MGALIPAVLRRATRRWTTTRALWQRLEELYGAHFRAEVGKVADRQLLSFHLDVVHGRFLPGHPDTVAAGLDFLEEVMRHPLTVGDRAFDAAVVEEEKALLQRRMEGVINDKGQYAAVRLLEAVAEGRRFGIRKWGRPEDLAAIDAQSLYAYYETVRQTRPLMVLAVGEVEPATLEAFLGRVGEDSGAAVALDPLAPYEPWHREAEVIERQAVSQGKLLQAYATGRTAAAPDFPALLMYAGVLGGFPHSKLFVNVREKHSMAYYAYARLDGALGLMTVGAGIEFAHYETVRRLIREAVEAMAAGAVTEQELAFTFEAYRNEIEAEHDAPDLLIGRQLEEALVGGGWSGPALIEALSRVRREDIARVAEGVALDTTYFLTREA